MKKSKVVKLNNVGISREVYLKLKMQACVENRSIKGILEEVVERYLEERQYESMETNGGVEQ